MNGVRAMSEKSVTLHFGVMSDTLSVQLASQGLEFKTERDLQRMEQIHFAVNVVYIHGYITDNQVKRMRLKLMDEVMACVRIQERLDE